MTQEQSEGHVEPSAASQLLNWKCWQLTKQTGDPSASQQCKTSKHDESMNSRQNKSGPYIHRFIHYGHLQPNSMTSVLQMLPKIWKKTNYDEILELKKNSYEVTLKH